ncbi:MAG: hypothetical protein Q7T89_09450 [Anaerolineales bacterium]|nr:hypothetical protein [Anaerolineales bacterium]
MLRSYNPEGMAGLQKIMRERQNPEGGVLTVRLPLTVSKQMTWFAPQSMTPLRGYLIHFA